MESLSHPAVVHIDEADVLSQSDQELQKVEIDKAERNDRAMFAQQLELAQPNRSTSNTHASLPQPQSEMQLQQASALASAAPRPPTVLHVSPVNPRFLDKKSSMNLQLDLILDRQIQALLDPDDSSLTRVSMADWDNVQLDRVVEHLQPQHLPELIRQSMLINELQPARPLSWKNLTYINQSRVPLIKNATGFLAPGHLVGIFSGPDGGATPLLNALGQRTAGGQVSGEMLYNGHPPDSTFTKSVGYVTKDDTHLATLTVYETIYFSARLRLPSTTPDSLVRFRVQMIMKLLGLSHVAASIVGNAAVRGISGGERRRVSFAVEMVVGHSVLLADLPTNGLDSATAFSLIRTMRFACRASTSMLCSIVQPSPELLRLFHRIIVLSKGATLYYGPPEHSELYFASHGFVRPDVKTVPQFLEELCASPESFWQPQLHRHISLSDQRSFSSTDMAYNNFSAWELKVLGSSHTKSKGILRPGSVLQGDPRRLDSWNALVDAYEQSEFKQLLLEQMVEAPYQRREDDLQLAQPRAYPSPSSFLSSPHTVLMSHWYRRYNSSPLQQMQQNLHRLAILFYRDKGMWRDRWIVNICMSMFLGSLFYDLQTTEQDINNRVGLLFFIIAYIGFGGISLAPVVSTHRATYYTQLEASYFHSFTYFSSFVLLLMPIVVVDVFLLLLPAYGLANLTGGVFHAEFGFALICLIVVAWTSRSWVLIVLALSKNEALAMVALVISNILFFLLAGFLIVVSEIEQGYQWFHVISYFSYAFRSLSINDISSRYNDCALNTPGCAFNTGDDGLVRLFGLHSGSNKWLDLARLFGVWAAFTIAAAFAYHYLSWNVADEPEGPNWGVHREAVAIKPAHSMVSVHPGETPTSPTCLPSPSAGDVELVVIDLPVQNTGVRSSSEQASAAVEVPTKDSLVSLQLNKAFIQWKDLCYDVTLSDGSTRRLLNNCFGFARPGFMCALMGASGAGKSTLLDVLAGIKNQGTITGELLINGRVRDSSFDNLVGYVEQFDSHNPLSTVIEAVRFSGRLRLPRTVSDEQLEDKVWTVLRLLEIDHLSDSIIGAPSIGGVVPEVRKKVTIAVELVTEPSILFLDEPTTGLDSASALAVISTVSKLSKLMAVVCTIHQPPAEIVNHFEDVLLMKAGGEVVYFGPTNQLAPYFSDQGLGQITPGKNPIDFALEQLKQANELAAKGMPSRQGDGGTDPRTAANGNDQALLPSSLCLLPSSAARLPELFLESPYSNSAKETLRNGICPPEVVKDDQAAELSRVAATEARAHFSTQVILVSRRFFLNTWRNRFGLKVRFGMTITFSLFVGTIFLRLGYNQQWGQQRLGAIFITVANTLYGSSAFLPEIYFYRTIYFREHNAKMFSAGSYFLARYVGDAPFVVLEQFITSLIVYFMVHLTSDNHSANFGYFFWCLMIVRWLSIAMTHLVGTMVASPGLAVTLLIAYMNTNFAACGFFMPRSSIGDQWVWYYDILPLRYGLDFLVQREYVDDVFYCSDNELVPVDPSYDRCEVPKPSFTADGFLLKCPTQCGLDFLDHFGVDSSTVWQVRNFAILHCFMLFFFVMAYCALRWINHIKR